MEQAPLVVEAVTMVDAAGVAVDEVIGVKVEDELLVLDDDPLDVDVVVLAIPRTAVGRLNDEAGEFALAIVTEGEDVDVDAAIDEDAEAAVLGVDEDVVAVAAPACIVVDEAVAEAGEQAVSDTAVAAAGPETVPEVAFVVCVPLAVPPEVLTKTVLRMSAFCQYCGAASITT